MGGCFTPLPQTADEVRDIADLLEADKTTDLYLQERASRSQVFALNEQQRLDDYRYIMFSVHGVLLKPKNEIEQSALVLSNPTTEGYLTMADAFALQLWSTSPPATADAVETSEAKGFAASLAPSCTPAPPPPASPFGQ